MELVKQNDPILKQVCKQFDFENPVMDPTQLVSEMQAIRKLDGGVGPVSYTHLTLPTSDLV